MCLNFDSTVLCYNLNYCKFIHYDIIMLIAAIIILTFWGD
jgi:hypothetical protein